MSKTITQLIFFGATGDLAFLKLFPAVWELHKNGLIKEEIQLIGFGRSKLTTEEFRSIFRESILAKFPNDKKEIELLIIKVFYFEGKYDEVQSFLNFTDWCLDLAQGKDILSLAYFSVPPTVFENILLNLSSTLQKKVLDLKVVIEKPFGNNESSAKHLMRVLSEKFEEKHIFLLDHFLGKRPIQSIWKLRLDNKVINLMINPTEIANIQITALETLDVGKRVGYYDQVGSLKDMVQSHLLQIMALITMDFPLNPCRESIQREKNNILSAVKFSGRPEDVVFGQYHGYQILDGVEPGSQTDTLIALKLMIDRRDWYDTPIYIRTGKALSESETKVVIEFKKMPFQEPDVKSNKLIFEMKPMEGIGLKLIQERQGKIKMETEELILQQSLACNTDFCLGDYASLIKDALEGKQDYFLSVEEIVASWKVVDRVIQLKEENKTELNCYERGSAGPLKYLELPKQDGFSWN